MSTYLKSAVPVSIEQMKSVYSRAKRHWSFKRRFNEGFHLICRLHFSTMQHSERLENLDLQRLTVKGEVDLRTLPFHNFAQILRMAQGAACDFSTVVTIGFNETASRQNRKYHDSIAVQLDDGSYYFSYRANGSVLTDVAYRSEFMRRVVSESNLPLNLVERDDFYELKHSEGGRLKILRSDFGWNNPTAFSCEILGGTSDILLNLMKEFLEAFGTSKRFRQHWKLYSKSPQQGHQGDASQGEKPNVDLALYKQITSHPELFPASRYELRFDCIIQDEQALEELRKLWNPQDRIFATLAAFSDPTIGELSFHVITHDVGHWIWLDYQGAAERGQLESDLGITLEEIREGWAFWEKE